MQQDDMCKFKKIQRRITEVLKKRNPKRMNLILSLCNYKGIVTNLIQRFSFKNILAFANKTCTPCGSPISRVI